MKLPTLKNKFVSVLDIYLWTKMCSIILIMKHNAYQQYITHHLFKLLFDTLKCLLNLID